MLFATPQIILMGRVAVVTCCRLTVCEAPLDSPQHFAPHPAKRAEGFVDHRETAPAAEVAVEIATLLAADTLHMIT